MRRIHTLLVICAVLLLSTLIVSLRPSLAAIDCSAPNLNTHDAIQCGANNANGGAGSGPSLDTVITRVINVLTAIVGVVAVIMIIVGGFRYVTSGGKQESIASAKNTILYAVVGLIVVALAQVIARFVLHKVTNAK